MLEEVDDDTYFVVEMSSHQLETLRRSPHIGVVLNLFQDHLDHTGSIEAYHNAKMNMFKYQDSNDYAIYYKDNETLNDRVNNLDIKSIKISVSTSDIADIYLKDNDIFLLLIKRKSQMLLCMKNLIDLVLLAYLDYLLFFF